VPKKSKTDPVIESSSSAASGGETPAAEAAALQKKKAPKSAKAPGRKGASKKSGAPKGGKKSATTRSKKAGVAEPSEADIRLRAYFIAERRVQLALQGDPSRDWLEAKQQLLQEAQQARA